MKVLKTIWWLLFIFVLFGAATAYLDYYNLTLGKAPVFCKKEYNEKTKVETSRGIFYIVERTTKQNPNETFNLSSNIKYRFLNKTLKIKLSSPKEKYDFILQVTPSIECPSPSRLYAELEDKKIYLDCIAEIHLKEASKKESVDLQEDFKGNPDRIEDIIKNLSFVGIEDDKTTEKYVTKDDTFSSKKLIIYRCNNETKDIYITQNNKMESNYCTIKNDSTKIEEEIAKEE